MYDGLRALNVADNRIHVESFGRSALRRSDVVALAALAPSLAPIATGPVRVVFAFSGGEADWTSGTLLDLAESQGLALAFGCRSGSCGTCRMRLIAGAITDAAEPDATRAEDGALICCATPAKGASEVRLAV